MRRKFDCLAQFSRNKEAIGRIERFETWFNQHNVGELFRLGKGPLKNNFHRITLFERYRQRTYSRSGKKFVFIFPRPVNRTCIRSRRLIDLYSIIIICDSYNLIIGTSCQIMCIIFDFDRRQSAFGRFKFVVDRAITDDNIIVNGCRNGYE